MNNPPHHQGSFALYPHEELVRISSIGGTTTYLRHGQEWMQKIGAAGGRAGVGDSKRHPMARLTKTERPFFLRV